MCSDNDCRTICGQSYVHLSAPGSRYNIGPECRTVIQDFIIRNRLTSVPRARDLNQLMGGMYLTQHGQDIKDLMIRKVEDCVKARINDMKRGGLIQSFNEKGAVVHVWRDDADNFLGQPGWIRDYSVEHGSRLGRRNRRDESRHQPRPVDETQSETQSPSAQLIINANTIVNGNTLNNRSVIIGGINSLGTISIPGYQEADRPSLSIEAPPPGDSNIYPIVLSDAGKNDDGSRETGANEVVEEDSDVEMTDAPPLRESRTRIHQQEHVHFHRHEHQWNNNYWPQ